MIVDKLFITRYNKIDLYIKNCCESLKFHVESCEGTPDNGFEGITSCIKVYIFDTEDNSEHYAYFNSIFMDKAIVRWINEEFCLS